MRLGRLGRLDISAAISLFQLATIFRSEFHVDYDDVLYTAGPDVFFRGPKNTKRAQYPAQGALRQVRLWCPLIRYIPSANDIAEDPYRKHQQIHRGHKR